MLYKMNQTEKTQTYKVKCQHCNYENIFYHLDWELENNLLISRIYTSMICQKCKKSIGEKEVLKQSMSALLARYDYLLNLISIIKRDEYD